MSSTMPVPRDLRENRSSADAARELELERIDQFLAVVSHELRSPLNGIQSWAHVIENHVRDTDDPTLQRAIAGILIGVEQQVRVIEDLLDGRDRTHIAMKEPAMADKKRQHANETDQDRNRNAEQPQRLDPEPDTMEGPGGRKESKAEQDATNKTTRRGER